MVCVVGVADALAEVVEEEAEEVAVAELELPDEEPAEEAPEYRAGPGTS